MKSSRLSHTTVVAYLALFVALGGTAVAVDGSLPGQNTVGTLDIINGEVKVDDIAQAAVATDEIVNGQVRTADIGDGEVSVADIAQNAVATDEVATGGVRTAEIANGQVQAEDLAAGVEPGASGARAYGTVLWNGDLSRAKGVTDVTAGGGIYCIALAGSINPATATLVVGADRVQSPFAPDIADFALAITDSSNDSCPAGELEITRSPTTETSPTTTMISATRTGMSCLRAPHPSPSSCRRESYEAPAIRSRPGAAAPSRPNPGRRRSPSRRSRAGPRCRHGSRCRVRGWPRRRGASSRPRRAESSGTPAGLARRARSAGRLPPPAARRRQRAGLAAGDAEKAFSTRSGARLTGSISSIVASPQRPKAEL